MPEVHGSEGKATLQCVQQNTVVGDASTTWFKALEGLIPITIWGFLVLVSEDVPSSPPAVTSKLVCAEMRQHKPFWL